MPNPRCVAAATLLTIVAWSAAAGHAQSPTVAVGSEFLVNTDVVDDQRNPAAAQLANGDFVVVWQTADPASGDSSGLGIQGQRYASDGTPAGSSFLVNSYSTGDQQQPTIAALDDGFVVAWQSLGSPEDDADDFSVQVQRFDAAGAPLGGQLQANSHTSGGQVSSAVSQTENGNFVVIWESDSASNGDSSTESIQGQLFTADGSRLGDQFLVNSYTTSQQRGPAVSAGDDGTFVVVWGSLGSESDDTSSGSIQGQRFAADGAELGGQFQVNSYTTGLQNEPAVAVTAAGNFVVTWSSYGSEGGDTTGFSVQARRFTADGAPAGTQWQVNSYATAAQREAAVAVDADGDFVIVWRSFGSNNGDPSLNSVQGRRYDAAGSPVASSFRVNSVTPQNQQAATIAATPAGDFVVAWHSAGSPGDASGYSIKAQRFRVTADIGDLVFEDVDSDGRQSISDIGASGKTVHLRDGFGTLLGSTTTDDSGAFLFRPKIALDGSSDEFYLEIEPGPTSTFTEANVGDDDTIDSDVDSQGQTPNFIVSSAGDLVDLDAGLVSNATGIGDRVWSDINLDGVQQVDEVGLAGITMRLLDSAGNVIETTTTDVNGIYRFLGIGDGDYRLEIVPPAGAVLTLRDAGDLDLLDSDFEPTTWRTELFSHTADAVRRDLDAGVVVAGAQTPTALAGDPIAVNSFTTGDQNDPEVAADADGNFIVVWDSNDAAVDTSLGSIQAQLFSADGAPFGSQFRVNSYTAEDQENARVAMNSAGDFVVVWDSYGYENGDSNYLAVQGQRFAADGTPLGEQFLVNTYTTYIQTNASVAIGEQGDFVVVWQSEGGFGDDDEAYSVQGQRFANDGLMLGGQFQVNTQTESGQRYPQVALRSNGEFLVVWRDSGNSQTVLRGQRFDAIGDPIAGEVLLTSNEAATVGTHDLAAHPDGAFVVAWETRDDGDGDGIRARRFEADGSPVGDAFPVNSYTTGQQSQPRVAMDPDGDFVIVWDSFGSNNGDDDRHSVQSQRYAADGAPIGHEFRVNSYTEDGQLWPAVAMDSHGDFVVAWTDYRDDLGDTSSRSINAQRVRVTADVGNQVFLDSNRDGRQSSVDSGIPGVPVDLYDVSGVLLDSTITDSDGLYGFRPKVAARNMVDQFFLVFGPAGAMEFTQQDVGFDDTADSDADPATGATAPFLLTTAAQQRLDLDAGFLETPLFGDGFESGDASAWSSATP